MTTRSSRFLASGALFAALSFSLVAAAALKKTGDASANFHATATGMSIDGKTSEDRHPGVGRLTYSTMTRAEAHDLHAEHALVEITAAVDVGDGEDQVVQAFKMDHARSVTLRAWRCCAGLGQWRCGIAPGIA